MPSVLTKHFTHESLSAPGRWLVAGSAAVAAIAHIPVIAPHLDQAPYMGVLFIVLTVACSVLAAAVLVRDSRVVYALVAITCGLAVVGYAATRVVAFPMLADDVGNWLEPLGVVSIVSESIAVAAALIALHRARQTSAPPARRRNQGVIL
ncbi:MAG: hypothetical protein ABI429_04190 [Jatrophihabitantaceae bacterium]